MLKRPENSVQNTKCDMKMIKRRISYHGILYHLYIENSNMFYSEIALSGCSSDRCVSSGQRKTRANNSLLPSEDPDDGSDGVTATAMHAPLCRKCNSNWKSCNC